MTRVAIAGFVVVFACTACGRSALVVERDASVSIDFGSSGASGNSAPAPSRNPAGAGQPSVTPSAPGDGGRPLTTFDGGSPMPRDAGRIGMTDAGSTVRPPDATMPSACAHFGASDLFCDGLARKQCLGSGVVSPSSCPAHAHCDSRASEFCACDDGYMDAGATQCVLLDRCKYDPCGPAPNTCSASTTSYSCTCGTGYTGSGTLGCSDIDECASGNGGCDPLVSCTNTLGGRTCGPCPPHFAGDGQSGCIQRWTQQIGSSSGDSDTGLAISPDGQIVLAGYTYGDFDGHANAGAIDALVIAYDSAGQKRWSTQIGSSMNDYAWCIAVAASGELYVGGDTEGDFDGHTSAGNVDAIVIKYDSAGQKLWSRQIGSSSTEHFYGIASDASGSAYAAGQTLGAVDGHTSAGGEDVLLVKYDTTGQLQWTEQFGSNADDGAMNVVSDASGNSYIVGYTQGGLDVYTNAGGLDLFVAKYDGDGHRQWIRQLGGAGSDYALGIATDAQGDVYVAGTTDGDFDGIVNMGTEAAFLCKFDSAGQKQWSRLLGTTADEHATRVTADAAGNAYVVGYSSVVAGANYDLLLAKFDTTGQLQWSRAIGTPQLDIAAGVALDAAGDLYLAGWTSGSLDGNSAAGGPDIVLVKYDSVGNEL